MLMIKKKPPPKLGGTAYAPGSLGLAQSDALSARDCQVGTNTAPQPRHVHYHTNHLRTTTRAFPPNIPGHYQADTTSTMIEKHTRYIHTYRTQVCKHHLRLKHHSYDTTTAVRTPAKPRAVTFNTPKKRAKKGKRAAPLLQH